MPLPVRGRHHRQVDPLLRFAREFGFTDHPQSLAALAEAGVTRAMTRGPGWRRTSHGFYAPARPTSPSPTQRIVDAVPLVPATGALTGRAAAYVHGCDLLDGIDSATMHQEPVSVLLGRDVGRRSTPGVIFRRDRLPEQERIRVHGLPVTTRERATLDAVRLALDLTEAVVRLDARPRPELSGDRGPARP
jgi:hypothetical protein